MIDTGTKSPWGIENEFSFFQPSGDKVIDDVEGFWTQISSGASDHGGSLTYSWTTSVTNTEGTTMSSSDTKGYTYTTGVNVKVKVGMEGSGTEFDVKAEMSKSASRTVT